MATITITKPDLGFAAVHIKGRAPYVQNRFGAKAQAQIQATQEAGSQSRSKKARTARDFAANYQDALHVTAEGWYGIPAPAIRAAMIDACRMTGAKMTFAKMSVFVQHDGFDKDDNTPLVRILGEPEAFMAYVRNQTGVVDLRCRPMWKEWDATVRLQWDLGQFSGSDILNLLMRAGLQVGIGEGRPFSKNSSGMGWGIFEVVSD